jgi:AbrB family looped-hinge helix DNA binding protein
MPVSTVSTKGQITLPIRLRQKLGIKPHDRVVVGLAQGAIVIRPTTGLWELEGFLGKAQSAEEEARALGQAAGAHLARQGP